MKKSEKTKMSGFSFIEVMGLMMVIVVITFVGIISIIKTNDGINNNYYYIGGVSKDIIPIADLTFEEKLDTIGKNCKSKFFTRHWNSKELVLFVSNEEICKQYNKKDSVCYLTIEECLK